MKLLGSTKRKITKDDNGENVLYLETNEVALIYSNVANNSYQQHSKSCIHLFLIIFLVNN